VSWSFVTLSGRFWMKRILFGGRYSSGICTFGRFVVSAAASPLPTGVTSISIRYLKERRRDGPSAASRFALSLVFKGFVYRVASGHGHGQGPVRATRQNKVLTLVLVPPRLVCVIVLAVELLHDDVTSCSCKGDLLRSSEHAVWITRKDGEDAPSACRRAGSP
jgi:hypothetical protein